MHIVRYVLHVYNCKLQQCKEQLVILVVEEFVFQGIYEYVYTQRNRSESDELNGTVNSMN